MTIVKIPIKVAETAQIITLDLQAPVSAHADSFTRLRFHAANHTYALQPAYTVRRLVPPTHPPEVNQDFEVKNLKFDPSNYFMLTRYSDAMGEHTLLFFLGESRSTDVDSILVIGFKPDGSPYKLLENGAIDITAFLPPEDNEPARIIGKPTLSQVMAGDGGNGSKAPYATTYDPFAVYVIAAPAGQATYSLSESRAYNQQHYVWAGANSREDYAVLYNIPGHRKVFGEAATDAVKTIQHASKNQQ